MAALHINHLLRMSLFRLRNQERMIDVAASEAGRAEVSVDQVQRSCRRQAEFNKLSLYRLLRRVCKCARAAAHLVIILPTNGCTYVFLSSATVARARARRGQQ